MKSVNETIGKYIIEDKLGMGSYSVVKKAMNRDTNRMVAIKIVDKHQLSRVERLALRQEIRILKMFQHPNIVSLYDDVSDDTTCYMIMEYMQHGDLFELLLKKKKMAVNDAQRLFACLVDAVEVIHGKNVIHRDIKPENVLLDGEKVKLCDFGFATQMTYDKEFIKDMCGTPGYAAPELMNGLPYGKKVDIFSLGVLLYVMICGHIPFSAKLAKNHKTLPALKFNARHWAVIENPVKELITRMLSINPDTRPSILELQSHPWVVQGKIRMEALCQKLINQRRIMAKKRQVQVVQDKKVALETGVSATKFGRNGLPHETLFVVKPIGMLEWRSKYPKRKVQKLFSRTKSSSIEKQTGGLYLSNESENKIQPVVQEYTGKPSSIHFRDVVRIVAGQATKVFQRYTTSCSEDRCMSIITNHRTLDLAFHNANERDLILQALEESMKDYNLTECSKSEYFIQPMAAAS